MATVEIQGVLTISEMLLSNTFMIIFWFSDIHFTVLDRSNYPAKFEDGRNIWHIIVHNYPADVAYVYRYITKFSSEYN